MMPDDSPTRLKGKPAANKRVAWCPPSVWRIHAAEPSATLASLSAIAPEPNALLAWPEAVASAPRAVPPKPGACAVVPIFRAARRRLVTEEDGVAE